MSNTSEKKELLRLKNLIVAKFSEEHWLELGILTDSLELVQGSEQPRLPRPWLGRH